MPEQWATVQIVPPEDATLEVWQRFAIVLDGEYWQVRDDQPAAEPWQRLNGVPGNTAMEPWQRRVIN